MSQNSKDRLDYTFLYPYRRIRDDGKLDCFLDTTVPFSETSYPVWDRERLPDNWEDLGFIPWPITIDRPIKPRPNF